MAQRSTQLLIVGLLQLAGLFLRHRRSLRRYLRGADGWINFAISFRVDGTPVEAGIEFDNGHIRVHRGPLSIADVTLVFADESALFDMLRLPPNEVLNLLLRNRLRTEGNLTYLNLFNFYLSLLLGEKHRRLAEQRARHRLVGGREGSLGPRRDLCEQMARRQQHRLKAPPRDPGVRYLTDPYLSSYGLADFPRLEAFLRLHFTVRPEVCVERPEILTDWYRANGFEHQGSGEPWVPVLRQAHALRHLLAHRKPIIRQNDLIAGTTTQKEIGVVIYPDAHGTMIWGELGSVTYRELNPYDISPAAVDVLHGRVFPFWAERNFREWVRNKAHNPLCQQLDERFAVYFSWKTAALSHTIADFPKLLRLGIRGVLAELEAEQQKDPNADETKRHTRQAMKLVLDGVVIYAHNLSARARVEAASETDPRRRVELERLAEICQKVPEHPAETLDEAINATWIMWVALHMENTNAGLSLGRVDQWWQPYFAADLERLTSVEARTTYVYRALELVGCFYLRCTDHLPLVPDIGNFLFGGSSSDQAITVGGVTPDGRDAVNDMTYIVLKVTEMLAIRDPNVNARFHPGINTDTYLRRLCEVNLITAATPSLHNDLAVMKSLEDLEYPLEDLRDWAATGCVEPTLSGKHLGHTNCMMMSLVAALEMALNDGRHPLMNWKVGPSTGQIERGAFCTFDDFWHAFAEQLRFLVDQAVTFNNLLAEAHAVLRPTPLLSTLIDGCAVTGRDVTVGGAKHNSSGAACIGLADVTDSLLVIEKLVFDDCAVSFAELKWAVDTNFAEAPALHARVQKRVPLFGSGNQAAVEMARRVAKLTQDSFRRHRNFRGGPYTAGFWSMSNHVAFGALAGALPSGRLAGKAFTPGLTPQPHASSNLLDNLRDVASLDPAQMRNNMAFNVKVVPSSQDPHETVVERMRAYAHTYFSLGGMQMQMNVVNSATLRDAMDHPEAYPHLLVRISGYNAYFVTLNRDMQQELIERAEFGISG